MNVLIDTPKYQKNILGFVLLAVRVPCTKKWKVKPLVYKHSEAVSVLPQSAGFYSTFTFMFSQARVVVVLRIKVPHHWLSFSFFVQKKSSTSVKQCHTMTLWANSNGVVQPRVLNAKQGGATCMFFAVNHLCAASNKPAAQHKMLEISRIYLDNMKVYHDSLPHVALSGKVWGGWKGLLCNLNLWKQKWQHKQACTIFFQFQKKLTEKWKVKLLGCESLFLPRHNQLGVILLSLSCFQPPPLHNKSSCGSAYQSASSVSFIFIFLFNVYK